MNTVKEAIFMISPLIITGIACWLFVLSNWFAKNVPFRGNRKEKEVPYWENYDWKTIMNELETHTMKAYAWDKWVDGLPQEAKLSLVYEGLNKVQLHAEEVEILQKIAYNKFLHS